MQQHALEQVKQFVVWRMVGEDQKLTTRIKAGFNASESVVRVCHETEKCFEFMMKATSGKLPHCKDLEQVVSSAVLANTSSTAVSAVLANTSSTAVLAVLANTTSTAVLAVLANTSSTAVLAVLANTSSTAVFSSLSSHMFETAADGNDMEMDLTEEFTAALRGVTGM